MKTKKFCKLEKQDIIGRKNQKNKRKKFRKKFSSAPIINYRLGLIIEYEFLEKIQDQSDIFQRI